MLYSMTGFGRAEGQAGEKTFLVEIKSLNGKQLDMRITIPPLLKPYEFEIRNIINETLERGSVECTIALRQNGASRPVSINTALAKAYYAPVARLAAELEIGTENLLSTLLKLPEVVMPETEAITDGEWKAFCSILREALAGLKDHRKQEGASLEKDLLERIRQIGEQQNVIAGLEPSRREKIRESMVKQLETLIGKDRYDENRLEQELIYYIEKIDISEEQVRLKNHLDYFLEVLAGPETGKGKKLSFILQEIGREINTTGSKANHAQIQQAVVLMKDELEKAKEQVLNVL